MANFFKIPKLLAEQIGYIEFAPGKAIDLTACKLRLNRYAIDEETIDTIKANRDAILQYVPQNLRLRIRQVIDMNKADHESANETQIANDLL